MAGFFSDFLGSKGDGSGCLLPIAGIFVWLFGRFSDYFQQGFGRPVRLLHLLVCSVYRLLLWFEASRFYPWEGPFLVIVWIYSRRVGFPIGVDLGYMDSLGFDHLRHAQRFTDSIVQPDIVLFRARHKFS